jgi:hypothetical protein
MICLSRPEWPRNGIGTDAFESTTRARNPRHLADEGKRAKGIGVEKTELP